MEYTIEYQGRELLVKAFYYPEEPKTYDYPGYPSSFKIVKVIYGKREITRCVNLNEIEQLLYDYEQN